MGIRRQLESKGRGTGRAQSASPKEVEKLLSSVTYGSIRIDVWPSSVVMVRTFADGLQEAMSVTHQKLNSKLERLFDEMF